MCRASRTIAERASLVVAALLLGLWGCERPAEPEPQETSQATGFLRPAEPEAGDVLAAENPEPVSQEPTPDPLTRPVDPPPPAPVPPEEPPRQDPVAGLPPPDASDLELAAALLHEPQAAFAQLVDRRGGALPRPRRQLLLAFAAARSGQLDAALRLAEGLDSSEALTAGERALLDRALRPGSSSADVPALAVASPLERAMELALLEREASDLATRGGHAAAARAWSQLLLAEIASPWAANRGSLARWSASLATEQAAHRWNPRGDWPSIEVTVQPGDSLIAIRKRVLAEHPELLLCTGLIAKANRLANEQAIRPDDVLRIPTDRASVLVDVSARWVFYLHADEIVAAWEVGVGAEEGSTRAGSYTISLKQTEPMWFRPGRDPVPFGDPENPLGTRWLEWGQDGKGTHLGFHGTDDPTGVGGRVSQGCVRMRNEDVEILYAVLPLGASVVVQP